MDIHEMVKEFADTYNVYQGYHPHIPSTAIVNLRLSLIREELDELEAGIEEVNIVEIADALGDLLYVVAGAALAFGIPLQRVTEEIHRSNMSKLGLDGKPVLRDDGKVLKGPNFTLPDIKSILESVK